MRVKASFRRFAGHKAPRSITLIVCEGETERLYFQTARRHYRLGNTEVIVAEDNDSAPISVVKYAQEKCQEPGGYDAVFCVFDRNGHESFDRARQKIADLAGQKRKPLPIEEAISIPCFELWLLLHFEQTDAPFPRCVDVINRLRGHIQHYTKTDAVIAEQLLRRVNTAIGNADWLAPRARDNNANPSTSVHHVLRHLERAGNQL